MNGVSVTQGLPLGGRLTQLRHIGTCALQYDCVGVGSGIKAETNRLIDEGLMPDNITLVPWNAGAEVLKPDHRIIPGDSNSPKNKDFYANLKAQGWWELRRRFERTYRAVNDPEFTFARFNRRIARAIVAEPFDDRRQMIEPSEASNYPRPYCS